jgi:transglutaminase-like putative cysteine protease
MRRLLGACLLLLGGVAQAQEGVHKRGDFEFTVAPAPEFAIVRPLPDAWPAGAPGATDAPWRTWRFDEQVDWRKGAHRNFIDYAFEARAASLVGDAGRYSITFNPEYQKLAIHRVELRRDGRWQDRLDPERISLARRESGFEDDTADGQVTALLLFDDVRSGDVVRVSYTIDGSNPVLAGQEVASANFGWRNPMLESRLRVLDDPGTRLSVQNEHEVPAAVHADTADGSEVLLVANAAPAVVYEDNYPAWYQPYPRVQVSVQRSWPDVVAWALPLYPAVEGRLPDDLEARLAQWRKLPDDGARLKAALRAVQDEVRYFGVEMGENTHRPAPPAETWRRRRGDCKDKAYLLVTLLGRMGIRAEPALTSAAQGRAVRERLPSAYDFDHVIVRAHVGGKPAWVDATTTQQGGDPRAADLSVFGLALPIVAGIDAPVEIAAPEETTAAVASVERYTPADDGGEVRFDVSTTYRGTYADIHRRSLASERPEDRSRRYADYYRKRFGDLRVLADPVASDDREANVLRIDESYMLAAPFENDAGAVRRLDLRADTLDDVMALPPTIARTGPLQFSRPGHYSHEVHLRIPSQWRPKFGAEQEDISAKAFDYARSASVDGRDAVLTYRFDVRDRDVAAADVGNHLDRLRRARDSLGASLRFSVPSAPDAGERAKRLQDLLHNVSAKEATP